MSRDESYAAGTAEQRSVLWTVLALNVLLVAMLGSAGAAANSTALLANALDNASDVAVYAIALFAIGRSVHWKRAAAAMSGAMLILFGVGVMGEALRRFATGSEPIGVTMMAASVVAAAINLYCLRQIDRLQPEEAHLQAAEKFSFNDFLSNGGVFVAGVLVALTGQRWPDLAVAIMVAAVAVKGGIDILNSARRGM